MPSREALDRYYESYYRSFGKERVTFYKPIRLARHIVSIVGFDSSHDIEIMDFGGGDGSISVLAAQLISRETKQRVRVQVVDLACHAMGTEAGVDVEFLQGLDKARGNCDLVIASAIFEHIPDLASALPEVLARLRKGGCIYIRTPYMLPFMKIIGLDMTYPAHVHDLGDRFWGNLPNWVSVPVEIVHAGPSPVESGFRGNMLASIAAHCLKLPSRIECLWTRNPLFKFYGGWEVVMRRIA
jgi:SAM-dependent methyltransferase